MYFLVIKKIIKEIGGVISVLIDIVINIDKENYFVNNSASQFGGCISSYENGQCDINFKNLFLSNRAGKNINFLIYIGSGGIIITRASSSMKLLKDNIFLFN